MEEDIKLLSNEELEEISCDDSTKMYLNEISQYEVLPQEEILNLLKQYRAGDLEAKNRIVEANLRLVVSIAKRYKNKLEYIEFNDIIQEGNAGLIKAIDSYDESRSAFSTYAFNRIEHSIIDAFGMQNTAIKRPIDFVRDTNRYKRLVAKYSIINASLPDDDEICKTLKISESRLKTIREELGKKVVNIDSLIYETFTIGDTIVSNISNQENVIEEMAQKEKLFVLKSVLNPLEYFILCELALKSHPMTLTQIGKIFNVTHERIRYCFNQAKRKVKPYLDENSIRYQRKLKELKNKYHDFSKLNVFPLNPEDILRYAFIKEHLTQEEQDLYYLKYVERNYYSEKDILKLWNIKEEKLKQLREQLQAKITYYFQNLEEYNQFKKLVLSTLKTKIMNLDKNVSLSHILEKIGMENLDYLLENYEQAISELSEEFQNLLVRYFKNTKNKNIDAKELEKQLNLALLDFESTIKEIEPQGLYSTYIRFQKDYTEEEQLFIESYILGKKEKEEFKKKYPNSKCLSRRKEIGVSLEKKYYKIPEFRELDFSKKMYLEIREKEGFLKKHKEILDDYFEISESNSITYTDSELKNAKEAAMNCYRNHGRTKEIDKNLYIPYLENPIYEFDENTREILTMYLIEGLDLEDIRKKRKEPFLTAMKLSNLITDNIDKIDTYRFGIVTPVSLDIEAMKNFIKTAKLTETEKKILELKYIKKISVAEIAKDVKEKEKSVFSSLTKVNKKFLSFLVKGRKLTDVELKREILLHPSESILEEESKKILSFAYGIASPYNKEGELYSINQIAEHYGVRNIKINYSIEESLEKIKLKEMGLLKKDLCFMKREELDKLLEDKHLPINETEKSIICSLFGLKDFPYETLDELAKRLNEKIPAIRQKYKRAMLKIFKYQNKEIGGKIVFELDIEPYLKYFPKQEQIFIIEYYLLGKTRNEIASRYHLTESQIKSKFLKIDFRLYCLREGKDISKFDFDAVEEAVKSPFFPYKEDKILMKQVFDLYFGQNSMETKTFEEIIKILNLNFERTTLQNRLLEFMISVCKYKDGIRKILNYNNEINRYNLNNMSKQDVCELLKGEDEKKIPTELKEELMAFFKITERDLMNDEERKAIDNLLHSLIQSKKSNLGISRK